MEDENRKKTPLSLSRKEGRAVRRNIVYFRTVSEVRNKNIRGEKRLKEVVCKPDWKI